MMRLGNRVALIGKTKAFVRGTDKEKPPRWNPGGPNGSPRWTSAFQRVTAFFALGFRRRDRQPHLLAHSPGQEPAHRVCLPAGGFHEFLERRAAGAPEQAEHLGSLGAWAGRGCLSGRLGGRPAPVGLRRRPGLVARPGPDRRNVGPVCRDTRLLGGLGRLSRGTGPGAGGFCGNAVHGAFSFGGVYRDPMDHSGSPESQANSGGNPHGRRIGDGGEFGLQIGADSGRC